LVGTFAENDITEKVVESTIKEAKRIKEAERHKSLSPHVRHHEDRNPSCHQEPQKGDA
jgi:hypothetical protein